MDPGDESGGAERLVSELSARFTRLPVERIHEEIERGLRRLVEFLDTDRSTLFEFSPDGTRLDGRRLVGAPRGGALHHPNRASRAALVPRPARPG